MTSDKIIDLTEETEIPDINISLFAHGRLKSGEELFEQILELVVAAEREACARICAEMDSSECAAAIRERGRE